MSGGQEQGWLGKGGGRTTELMLIVINTVMAKTASPAAGREPGEPEITAFSVHEAEEGGCRLEITQLDS